MTAKYKPIRTNILVAMAKKGYNQQELSKKSDVNPSTISLFLNGRRSGFVAHRTAFKISRSLNVDLTELFEIVIRK